MKEFFKFVFASMVGVLLSVFVMFVLGILLIIGIITSASNESKVTIQDNTVLHLNLDYPLSERTSKNPFQNLNFGGFEANNNLGLNDILANIKEAKNDDRIKGIYLDISAIQGGFASIEEIRNALVDFKKSGKFILAYSEVYTKGAYYLASVADKIYLNPQGIVDFKGFSTEIMFFKGALEKLDIEAQVIKVGTYKSAVEPYLLDKISKPNREQITSFLGSMYSHFLTNIASSRKVSADSLRAIANNASIQTAEDAVKYHLVDGLKYKDEVLTELKSLCGIAQTKDLRSVSIAEYSPKTKESSNASADRIAVVYAVGEIVGGEGNDQTIGSENISRAIRSARLDEKVKAVVLRINSPGGSSLASDVIWREVELTKKVKPVIVSMGDVAASGGYYIACAADSIFAEPNTITGSIGVFAIIPNMKKFFNNKLGITFDEVKTGKFSQISVTRPLSDDERLLLQAEINNIYKTFTQKVADGRHKTPEYIDKIGQGRVWTGAEAIEIGLVDRLGNIEDAVKAAAKKAGLKEYKLVDYPFQKDPLKELFDDSADKVRTYFTKQELGENYSYYQKMQSVLKTTGIQSRIPYDMAIK
ncbi:MAG: signal peptide peptidase SppA [Sphingobacteriaceae bacterium]